MIMNDKLHHKISKTLHQCISFAPLSKREYFNGRHPAVTEKLPLKNNRNATSTIMQMYKCKQIQIHTGSYWSTTSNYYETSKTFKWHKMMNEKSTNTI